MDSATGCISTPRELLANTLANCTAFRSWSGPTWSVSEAATHVHQQALPEEGEDWLSMDAARPFAVIARPDHANRIRREAQPRGFIAAGGFVVELHWSPPSLDRDDHGKNIRAFENFLGALIMTGDVNAPGICELSGTYGYLNASDIIVDGPYRVRPDEVPVVGDCYVAYLNIEFGDRS